VKKTYWFLFIFISMIFQSCFEVIEQLQIKNDGSGNFQLTFNLSKSKTKLNSISKLQTINGHPVPSRQNINEKLQEIESAAAKTPGISNVKTTVDFDNYIAVLSCSFISIAQLNKAIKNVKVKEKATGAALEDNYAYDGNTKIFQRKNNVPLKEKYLSMSKADKEVFSNAGYTTIYKFESGVGSISNKEAKLSATKKAVMLNLQALDIVTEKKSIENKINITNQ
jgi:hypothetical protein